MIITKKNQVEHKIIKLDRFRRSSTKLVPPPVQPEPTSIPYQPHLHQSNQLQFQDKPIQYYTNNNFIYNNVSPVQFPQSFIETNQTKDIPLNKSKSISFIAYNSQCQKELQNENEVNGNVLLLTPSSNYVYNKTPSKVSESVAFSKSKQSLQQESKWNMVIMPCQNENMEIVREVNETGYNSGNSNSNCNNNNNNKENSTMFQTEHSQLIIENTPSRTNNNNGQMMLLKEIYESGNDDNVEQQHKDEEEDVTLFKGDKTNNNNNNNNIIHSNNSKTQNNCNYNNSVNIPMRNILPFNKSITPLFNNTNPTSSSLNAHNTSSSSHNKINTILHNALNTSQKHHASPSLQIHNLKRFHTERSNTNSISNNFLLETISFNHHHSPKAINHQSMNSNSNSKQIRAIILKESITEVNKHKHQCEGNTHINTYSNVNSEMNIIEQPSSSNRIIVHDEYLSSQHTTKSNRSKLIKVNVNQSTSMRNAVGGKGKSFLTPKGNDNEKKNILFPSFLKNDKIAIMKYKNLLKNTSSVNTPPSTPCATNNNNNKVIMNIQQQTNVDNNQVKHNNNNNLSNKDKKQITTATKTSSRSKGKNILDNKTKYQNVINSFYSSTDIPHLSYKHSFVETKRTGLNLFTKLALPANNFDNNSNNDKERNLNYIHI